MSLKEDPSSSSPQYPTSDELMTAFTNLKFPEDMNRLQDLHAGDHHGVVTGHDHSFVGEHHSHDSWFEHLYSLIGSLEDTKLDIVRVIGGGSSPWACVEGKATAKTKIGEDYNNEFVYVMHFNDEGKIDKTRAYYDSAHLEKTLKA